MAATQPFIPTEMRCISTVELPVLLLKKGIDVQPVTLYRYLDYKRLFACLALPCPTTHTHQHGRLAGDRQGPTKPQQTDGNSGYSNNWMVNCDVGNFRTLFGK